MTLNNDEVIITSQKAPFKDHWEEANAETWKAMEELYEAGKIRAIGISNFRQQHIDALLKTAKIKPMVNQIRLCPGETQDAVLIQLSFLILFG